MTNEIGAQLMTAEEVSRLLRIKPATLYEAAAKGRIPCVRLWEGRRKALVRFRLADLEEFIREHTIGVRPHSA